MITVFTSVEADVDMDAVAWASYVYFEGTNSDMLIGTCAQKAGIIGTIGISALTRTITCLEKMNTSLFLEVEMICDNLYAVNCINKWYHQWDKTDKRPRWTKSDGSPVKNRPQIEELHRLVEKHKINLTYEQRNPMSLHTSKAKNEIFYQMSCGNLDFKLKLRDVTLLD